MALDDSIPTTKNYQEHIYFVFKLDEPELLGSKKIGYEYARISRRPWNMKNGIKNLREKHPGSIIILKMVNDPLRVRKKVIASQYFDVISVLIKEMIIFCLLMKPHERIFYVILKGWNNAGPFQDIF